MDIEDPPSPSGPAPPAYSASEQEFDHKTSQALQESLAISPPQLGTTEWDEARLEAEWRSRQAGNVIPQSSPLIPAPHLSEKATIALAAAQSQRPILPTSASSSGRRPLPLPPGALRAAPASLSPNKDMQSFGDNAIRFAADATRATRSPLAVTHDSVAPAIPPSQHDFSLEDDLPDDYEPPPSFQASQPPRPNYYPPHTSPGYFNPAPVPYSHPSPPPSPLVSPATRMNELPQILDTRKSPVPRRVSYQKDPIPSPPVQFVAAQPSHRYSTSPPVSEATTYGAQNAAAFYSSAVSAHLPSLPPPRTLLGQRKANPLPPQAPPELPRTESPLQYGMGYSAGYGAGYGPGYGSANGASYGTSYPYEAQSPAPGMAPFYSGPHAVLPRNSHVAMSSQPPSTQYDSSRRPVAPPYSWAPGSGPAPRY